MLKSYLVCALMLLSFSAAATTFNCKATKVTGRPLEESFSVEEYPEVSIEPTQVWFGSSLYSKAHGDTITIKRSAKTTSVTVVTKDESEEFDVIINNKTKKGTIVYKTPDTLEDMADITCKI